MKIGIITYHQTNNFGALLQTYALYYKIRDLGYSCEIINYQCPNLITREKPKWPKLRKNLFKYVKNIISDKSRIKYYRLFRFLHKYAIVSKQYNRNNIGSLVEKYDKIVVGSDLVWDMDINGGDLTFFLDFVNNSKKKFAFASSAGFPWNEENKKILSPLLADFSHIAVREEQTASWVEELIGERPSVVCDPTMLLTTQNWQQFVTKDYFAEKYVLVYMDNDKGDCIRVAKEYAIKYNKIVKFIDYRIMRDKELVAPTTIEDFLSLIYYADLVVTASYHGILFSLYFQKPLIYFLRRQTSRVETLVAKLGLGEYNGGNITTLDNTLDYEQINNKIKKFRQESILVLKQMLNS